MQTTERIRLLGCDWLITQAEVVDEDPKMACTVNHEACTIVLSESTHPSRKAWHLFWALLRAAEEYVLDGDAYPANDQERDAAHTSLWAVLHDNWGVIDGWFHEPENLTPYDGQVLWIGGLGYVIRRPHLVPGHNSDMMGQAHNETNTIYVRSVLGPGRAAQTALHELMHAAIGMVCRLGFAEAYIKPMASVLAQVIADNPEAMRMLFAGEVAHA